MADTPPAPDSAALERIRARRQGAPAGDAAPPPERKPLHVRLGREIRGWADALALAILLAMFIRTYVFELFVIPTGSMTPTLIGDDARLVSEFDWDNDDQTDIVVQQPRGAGRYLQVHLRNEDGLFEGLRLLEDPAPEVRETFARPTNPGKGRRDMIMVAKFAYWFSPPQRGDIVVFKVPDREDIGPQHRFRPETPVFIKRCVGLPGETLTIQPIAGYSVHRQGDPDRRTPDRYGGTELLLVPQPVLIDGEPLAGGVFDRIPHFPPPGRFYPLDPPRADDEPVVLALDNRSVALLGDNQMSSSDSRYWEGVPVEHLRGRAIMRYFPVRSFGFLNRGE